MPPVETTEKSREGDLAPRGPWAKGVNNRQPDHLLDSQTLRYASNFDVLNDGTLRRREGSTLQLAGVSHSLFSYGSSFFGVVDGSLSALQRQPDGTLDATALSAVTGTSSVAYVGVNLRTIYWSNGINTGMLYDLNPTHATPNTRYLVLSWGLEAPSGQPAISSLPNGGLGAGRYQIAVTFVRTTTPSEESGTGAAVAVDVPSGGGIQLQAIPQPVDPTINKIRIYSTQCNGKQFYRYRDIDVGVISDVVFASATLGAVLKTQFLRPPPPGTSLAFYKGRIWIASGRLLYVTEPFRLGAFFPMAAFEFPESIAFVTTFEGGLLVASDQHYQLLGKVPADMQQISLLPYRGIPGTVTSFGDADAKAWISERGLIVADDSGQLKNVSEDSLAFDNYKRGALLLRESDSIKKFIAVLQDGTANPFVSTDFQRVKSLLGV